MTWQDVVAIAIGAAAFVAYLYYINRVYPGNCTDACEREYYSGPEYISYVETTAVELDPGDEQPVKRK